jgi:hypothetical protein
LKIVKSALASRDLGLILGDLAFRRTRASLWQDNRSLWAPELVEGFAGSVQITPTHGIVTNLLRSMVNQYIPVQARDRVVTQYCCWGSDSGINPHRDERYRWAATLYLNDDWCESFGGMFLADGAKVMPERGLLVINDQQALHCVTRIKPNVPERVTVQIWAL